jgi:DNA-binding SARP family transcriptional activator
LTLKLRNELLFIRRIGRALCFTVVCFFSQGIFAQDNYGLAFNSFNVSQEKRTALEIGGNQPVCLSGNIDFSFDFYFLSGRADYFGYLFRLINNSGQNVDLLYNQKDLVFNTVVGGSFSNINFSIDSAKLYASWTNIRYHFSDNALSCFINGKLYKTVQFTLKDKCFRLLFGANTLREFSTTDVPAMVIRNISIRDNESPKYFWALNNMAASNEIEDSISRELAVVHNPVWQSQLHAQWQLLRAIDVKGNASITYNPANEAVYIVAQDTVYRLSVGDIMSTAVQSPFTNYRLWQGNQSVYNLVDSSIYNFYIDKNEIARFEPGRFAWDQKFDSVPNTEYGHSNKIYVREENALYIFGGYGQMKYKNRVQRYDVPTKKWEDINAGGDYFTPRYLAAAAKCGNDIYILGGYGSHSGDQLLNPGYLYDLVQYHIPTHTFKKIYSLPEPDTSLVFAGSMYIDSAVQTYYALCYDKGKYDTKLRLVKGSLLKPQYEFVGDEIPYSFHDLVSDADLFYSAHSKQLIAVTQLVNLEKNTQVKIFGIAFPPENFTGKTAVAHTSKYFYVVAGIVLLLLIYFFIRKKKEKIQRATLFRKTSKKPAAHGIEPFSETEYNHVVHSELTGKLLENNTPDFILHRENPVIVRVFGTLELLDEEGEDVAKQFSPLLKELFLVILLYTLKNGKGVTSEKLNEIFWENKTGKNAKNNLSVNIVRLKNILSKIGAIQIAKTGEHWLCEYDNKKVSIDLADYLALRTAYPAEHGKSYLDKMLYFLSRGSFLKQIEAAWLDDIKADVNNKVIDDLTEEIVRLDIKDDAEYIIKVAGCIFNFDPLNDDALRYKCQTLDRLGRHSIAKTTYERFAKEYRKSYGEDFQLSFNDILK